MPLRCTDMGFIEGGSCWLQAIAALEKQLNKREKKSKSGEKVSIKDLRDIDQQKAAKSNV